MELTDKLGELGLLDHPLPLTISAPTGAGKTHIALKMAQRLVHKGERVIYLTPLRAQAQELFERFAPEVEGTGLLVGGTPWSKTLQQAPLLIATYEALIPRFAYFRTNLTWIASIGMIIIDEIHLLESPHRGAALEQLISWIKRVAPMITLVTLSGTLGKDPALLSFLGTGYVHTDTRPVPLTVRTVRYESAHKERTLCDIIDPEKITLVFVHSRYRAERLSALLNEGGVPTRYHHAGLSHDERKEVERALTDRALRCVVATPTLEMGLNLPVSVVILYDLYFLERGVWRLISQRALFQRLGRAGRPGLDTAGEGVVMIPRREKMADQLLRGPFAPVSSTINNERAMIRFLFQEMAFGYAHSRVQLERAFSTTLAGARGIRPDFGRLLSSLVLSGHLTLREGKPVLSVEVRRAVRSFLDPYALAAVLRKCSPAMTPFDLLVTLSCTPEVEAPPLSKEEIPLLEAHLSTCHTGVAGYLLTLESLFSRERLLAALKLATILATPLRERIATEPTLEVNSAAMARSFAGIRRYLTTLGLFLSTHFAEHQSPMRHLFTITAGVAEGLTLQAATLTLIPHIGPRRAKKLSDRGIKTLGQLAAATPEQLKGLLPKKSIATIVATARALTTNAPLYSHGHPIALTRAPEGVDPLRLKRATNLGVFPTVRGYMVSGRFSHYETTLTSCSCPDAAAGHRCKHQLAVALHTGTLPLPRPPQDDDPTINLTALWFHTL